MTSTAATKRRGIRRGVSTVGTTPWKGRAISVDDLRVDDVRVVGGVDLR